MLCSLVFISFQFKENAKRNRQEMQNAKLRPRTMSSSVSTVSKTNQTDQSERVPVNYHTGEKKGGGKLRKHRKIVRQKKRDDGWTIVDYPKEKRREAHV